MGVRGRANHHRNATADILVCSHHCGPRAVAPAPRPFPMAARYGDDAFTSAVSSPMTGRKPRPPALPSSQEWYRGLGDGVELALWPPELQAVTLREVCPFGLDWECKVRRRACVCTPCAGPIDACAV